MWRPCVRYWRTHRCTSKIYQREDHHLNDINKVNNNSVIVTRKQAKIFVARYRL